MTRHFHFHLKIQTWGIIYFLECNCTRGTHVIYYMYLSVKVKKKNMSEINDMQVPNLSFWELEMASEEDFSPTLCYLTAPRGFQWIVKVHISSQFCKPSWSGFIIQHHHPWGWPELAQNLAFPFQGAQCLPILSHSSHFSCPPVQGYCTVWVVVRTANFNYHGFS